MQMNAQRSSQLSAGLRYASRDVKPPVGPSNALRHVVFGVDDGFFPHAWATLVSVLRAEPDAHYHFHFVTCGCLNARFAQLAPFIQSLNCAISVHHVALELLETLPASRVFPTSIYFRLLAPYVLGDVPHMLYLDADIVCLRPLAPLWSSLEHSEQLVAAVEDGPEASAERIAALGLPGPRYFNSGVLFVHLERWRAQGISEQVLACIAERRNALVYPDQDALNIVLQGKVHYLPAAWNYQVKLAIDGANPPADTALLHYTGQNKPWQVWNDQPAADHYRCVRALLPWGQAPYEAPTTVRQLKQMYSYCLRRGEYAASLYWLVARRWAQLRSRVRKQPDNRTATT